MAVKNDLKKLRKEQRLKQADLATVCAKEASATSSSKRIRPALKQLFALQHILKSLWKISSIWTLKKTNPKEGGRL